MAYIHELAGWPELHWDEQALAKRLAAVRFRQGCLLGRMGVIGFELRQEASVTSLTQEVVRNSAIEGEVLSTDEVRSSITRRLGLETAGLPHPSPTVEGVVELMLDATRNFDRPLTAERLFGWHAALFPAGHSGIQRITVAAWRTGTAGPMRVVSGAVGKERVHFEAPAATRIEGEMARFIVWFNTVSGVDPVIKAAVAHFWFVTIHPFADGNGRIARAIADMALARADGSGDRFYSMSSAIEAERKEYYTQLESAQHGSLDITAWIAWFLGCLGRAIDGAEEMLESVIWKANLWQKINKKPVNDRQRNVINRMLDDWQGAMTTSKYAKLVKCSTDTALRDIQELQDRAILIKNSAGGRSTSYRLAEPGREQGRILVRWSSP